MGPWRVEARVIVQAAALVALLVGATFGQDADLGQAVPRTGDGGLDVQKAISRYRELALAHPQAPAIHGFSVRVAVTRACRAATVDAAEEWKDRLSKGEELTEHQIAYVPLRIYNTHMSYRSPLEDGTGELPEEMISFLKDLETTLRQEADVALLERMAQLEGSVPGEACQALVTVYFAATRSGEDLHSDCVSLGAQARRMDLLESVASFWLQEDRNSDEAVDLLLLVAADMPSTEEGARYLLRAAQVRTNQGWHYEAADLYRKVVSEFPGTDAAPEAQYELVQLYVKAWHNYASAANECERLIDLFPRSAYAVRAQFLIGQYQYQDGKYEEACGAMRTFRAERPGSNLDVHAGMLLGLSLIGVGKSTEAVKEFEAIVQSHPEHELAPRAQYLVAYALLSEQKYDQALGEFRKFVDHYPDAKNVAQARQFIEKLSAATKK